MKAAVYYGPEDLRVEEVQKPVAGKDGIVVKVKDCGICPILDLTFWRTMVSMNLGNVPGHEFSAEVVEVGSNVSLVKPGDRIYTFDPYVPCYRCPQCLQGDYWRCSNWGEGIGKNGGAYAEYMRIPFVTPDSHIVLPENVGWRELALIEPLHLSIGLANKVKPGETVLIIGQHLIGLGLTAQLKKTGKAGRIITSAISRKHLDASLELGADMAIDSVNQDLVRTIMKETKGRGADKVFVTDVRPVSFMDGFACARDAGQVLLATRSLVPQDPHLRTGWVGPNASSTEKMPAFDTGVIYYESAWGTLGTRVPLWESAIELLQSGTITAEKHITHVFPLEKINEAFRVAVDFHESIEVMIEF